MARSLAPSGNLKRKGVFYMRKTLAQRCTALLLALLLIGTAAVEVRASGSEAAEIELPEMTTGDTLRRAGVYHRPAGPHRPGHSVLQLQVG